MDLFSSLLSKTVFSLSGRGISQLLLKMGFFSGGLVLAVAWSLKFFIEDWENVVMTMMPAEGEGNADLNQPDAAATDEPGDPGGTSRNEASSSSVSDHASSSHKSALDDRKEELILDNLHQRKGDLGDGQRLSSVRETLESEFNISHKGEEFEFVKQMEKETGANKEESPATNSTFNEISNYQSKSQRRE